ncbi:hypothetical protein [Leifsonia sp. WHRI 6310E]|uniref:hypothetical protein n=1 Tax=Leifsonia sp. WHRI 6310E TaxID=3162562 RepID=UPI0032EAEA85
MALGALLAASAFEVSPRQEGGFQGGFVENLDDLSAALNEKSMIDALRSGTPMNFSFEADSRLHEVRDSVMSFAFDGDEAVRLEATRALCGRLASQMDGRNKNCLLLTSLHAMSSDAAKEVIIWMFPYDRVIQRSGQHVQLQDAFSLTSGLRKAASFAGMNLKSGFLTGKALDHQSSNVDQRVATFWISGFLGAELQVQSREGTALAAKLFRAANKALAGDEKSQEQLVAGITSLRNRADRPWTIENIGEQLLPPGPAREAFAAAAGFGPETHAPFSLDVDQFDERIKFRVFKLENGITVSSPFVEVGKNVQVKESADGATLYAQGKIRGETIRSTS